MTVKAEERREEGGREDSLSREDWRRLLLLGVPTFGMALSITAVSTYGPVVARGFDASTIAIGLIIGGEGVMALWIPLVAGSRSDRLRTSLGGRLPFVLAGTPVMVVCLALLGRVGSIGAMAIVVGLFFAGYFVAYEPYRALYPDLLREQVASRAQSVQAGWRGLGTVTALAGGGALLAVAEFLPFAVFALLLALSVGAFVWLLLRGGYRDSIADERGEAPPAHRVFGHVLELLREHPALRGYLFANALWELSLGALKTFVVLYVTAGLGYGLGSASLIIGGVAVVVLLGALLSGAVADRFGRLRVTETALWIYGVTLLIPGLFTAPPAILVGMPFIALGGGTLMSLPYSLLIPLMPETEHGVLTGLYSLSRGLGVMLGPLLAGVAIKVSAPLLASTDGYAATWFVSGGAILLSIPLLRSMRDSGEDRRELRRD